MSKELLKLMVELENIPDAAVKASEHAVDQYGLELKFNPKPKQEDIDFNTQRAFLEGYLWARSHLNEAE